MPATIVIQSHRVVTHVATIAILVVRTVSRLLTLTTHHRRRHRTPPMDSTLRFPELTLRTLSHRRTILSNNQGTIVTKTPPPLINALNARKSQRSD
ncbi:hypothetical protein L1887_41831 [Cichorium endivia]|nr:hypothetical protein L1887_41831 [Cichorium endivia]